MTSNPRIGRFDAHRAAPGGDSVHRHIDLTHDLPHRHDLQPGHDHGDQYGHPHAGVDGVGLVAGDLAFVVEIRDGREQHRGGVILGEDAGLLMIAFPHGVEFMNMRALTFVRAWRVEHTPRELSTDEAYRYARTRLAELSRSPLVVVEPADERAG